MSVQDKLELANSADAAAAAAEWLDHLAEKYAFPPKLIAHLRIMMEEVMANYWAYGAESTKLVKLRLEVEPASVRLSFADNGQPFDLRQVESHSVGTSLNDARIGGLGLQLIKKFADQIDYRSEGGWNELTLSKKRLLQ